MLRPDPTRVKVLFLSDLRLLQSDAQGTAGVLKYIVRHSHVRHSHELLSWPNHVLLCTRLSDQPGSNGVPDYVE